MKTKEKVVHGLTSGIEHLFKKNKVEYKKGVGEFIDPHTLSVHHTDGNDTKLTFENAIIATGSEFNNLPGGILPIDEKVVCSSTGIIYYLFYFQIYYLNYLFIYLLLFIIY
jgi:dihydrolipoamide dehydrogenase